jgi:orotidine-5'-phosphate decarboxylase
MKGKDRIIVALDVDTIEAALAHVLQLRDHVGLFKIGLELIFTILVQLLTPKSFKQAARNLQQARELFTALSDRIMLDGKFKDIPNTMAGAARAAHMLGVKMFTVHASASQAGMAAAVDAAPGTGVIAVTVLTSMDEDTSREVYGTGSGEGVLRFARLAVRAKATHLVCSPQDLPALQADPDLAALVKITPGVRSATADAGDQARIATPAQAVKSGATYVVVGREITRPKGETSVQAAQRIAAAIDEALCA